MPLAEGALVAPLGDEVVVLVPDAAPGDCLDDQVDFFLALRIR